MKKLKGNEAMNDHRADPTGCGRDFDHHGQRYAHDPCGVLSELRQRCPVARSDHHGGYWVLTRYADIERVARDYETFSSDHDLTGDGTGFGGITIPPTGSYRRNPVEIDPPQMLKYRHLLNPFFAPGAIERTRPRIERWVTACIDRVIESGSFDVVLDLAMPVPALFTADFLGLPLEDWEDWSWPQHQLNFAPPGSAQSDAAKRLMSENQGRLLDRVHQRRRQPANDLITVLVQAAIDSAPLTDTEIVEICMTIISGGFVTTTALTAHALSWLAANPQERKRLGDDPTAIPRATEEFLRVFSPAHALARTVTRDVELGGQHLRAGDRVLVSWAAANWDPAVFDAPGEMRLDRTPNRHASFGFGIHRCIGNSFARTEFEIMVREVLRRMPDYTIDVSATHPYPSIGVINGIISMPATFTPGPIIGTSRDLVVSKRR